VKLWSKVIKVIDKIVDLGASLAAWLLGLMMVLITTEIITRYFFNKPITWSIEVTEYGILWVTFLSTAWVLKKGGHVVTDLVLDQVNPRTRRILNIFTSTVATCACLVFTFYAIKVTLDLCQRGLTLATVLKPLAWILYMVIPAGSILLSLQFMRRTYGFIVGGKTASAESQESTKAPTY
jgi:C4-dicarboxylate transporter DctQ subunit